MLETFRGAPHQPAQLTVSDFLPTDSVRPVSVAPVSGSGATSVPVQIMTVDGLVSTFAVANGVPTISDTTQCPSTSEGTSTNMTYFRIGEGSSGTPMVLDFSGSASSNADTVAVGIPTAARRRGQSRSRRVPIRRQHARTAIVRIYSLGVAKVLAFLYLPSFTINYSIAIGNQHRVDSNELPTQGPIAPPQREGAPTDYKYFGRCDQVCDHCHAVFLLEEKRTGLPVSAAPQYAKCCAAHEVQHRLSHFEAHERQALREDIIEGLIQFLDDNNALVQLFRTARDKLLEANIPNFQIRLFGVPGSNQYELPTADTIGAIVEMELTSDANAASKIMANPVAPQRSLAYFADLNPTDNTKFIEARVYRRWTAMKVPSLIPTGFSCILLDKKGSAIQANADLKEKARFEHYLQPNCVYRIEGFGFEKTDGWGKTLDNDFTLCLGKHTRVDLLKDDEFPHHYFNFAAYNELDYIGYIHNVEKVKEYGSAAGQIQLSATSATRYYFNPPIEETSELLAAYNQDNAQVPQLEVQTERLVDWEQERTRNRVPLATLLPIDPNTQQRVLFTQDAMIVRVDTTYDWYYQKCDECGGKLDYGFIHGHCHPYGTQSTPQNR
ncbi:nucleic acid-binding, OB-fold protein [Artemisia annua]|uniref:Nucleic acid-binding, OB-fold protein n=1 Tax=Artemisia annua TaxID=35608 RepID=A0A2U1NIV1_ARTAN|nr:nucleic acid-binding, OB-fold protein [Artemisia annua]